MFRKNTVAGLATMAFVFLIPAPPAAAKSSPMAPLPPRPAINNSENSEVFGGTDAARDLWDAQGQYEAQRKSSALAFALELAVPSVGNFYAGEKEDAILTLTGVAIGAFFLADGYGLFCQTFKGADAQCNRKTFSMVQGWVFLAGSRLFGLSSAPQNVARNNRALRARLGLDEASALRLMPWVASNEAGFALALRF